MSAPSSFESGPELVEALADHAHPVSNLVWADRHGSIGYKTVGRIPMRPGGCPDLPKPGWTAEYEWDGWVPYEELPEVRDPESRIPGHGEQPDRARRTTRTTSRATISTATGPNGSRSCIEARARARPGELRVDADGHAVPSRPRDGAPPRPAAPARPARAFGDRAAALLGRDGCARTRSRRRSTRRSRCGWAARSPARRSRDRDLSERWLDRADNGFIAHVTSPWRWQAHLLALWAEGDEELVGRPWDELALDALRGALDDLESRFGLDPDGMALGQACIRWSSRTRSAQLHRCSLGSSTAGSRWGAARRPSLRSAGTPTTRSPRSGRPAGGWSPTRCARSARAGRRSPGSRARWRARTTTTCRRTG